MCIPCLLAINTKTGDKPLRVRSLWHFCRIFTCVLRKHVHQFLVVLQTVYSMHFILWTLLSCLRLKHSSLLIHTHTHIKSCRFCSNCVSVYISWKRYGDWLKNLSSSYVIRVVKYFFTFHRINGATLACIWAHFMQISLENIGQLNLEANMCDKKLSI